MRDRDSESRFGRRRGQSELVGFLLIFGVVVLTISLVGLTGFVALEDARDYQRATNAERAFTALSNDVDDVVRGASPGRTTEIRLADAQLSLAEAETVTVEAGGDNWTVETQPVVYDSGSDTTITYHGGSLVRQDGDSPVMFREPRFVIDDDAVILPVINTTLVGGGPVGGTTAVEVGTWDAGTDVLVANGSVDSVTLRISTPHPEVWVRYFERFDAASVATGPDGDSVEVTLDTRNTDQVYVTVHHVHVTVR